MLKVLEPEQYVAHIPVYPIFFAPVESEIIKLRQQFSLDVVIPSLDFARLNAKIFCNGMH
jgi:hypothetical protein